MRTFPLCGQADPALGWEVLREPPALSALLLPFPGSSQFPLPCCASLALGCARSQASASPPVPALSKDLVTESWQAEFGGSLCSLKPRNATRAERHLLGLLCSALGSDPLINPCHGSNLGCSAAFQVMGSDPECRGQFLGWKCPLEGRSCCCCYK